METDYLRTFLLVLDAGSMSEAARRLAITPAAVAQQMRSLERELDAQLMARSGRTVRPTEAGMRLGELGQTLMRDISSLRAQLSENSDCGELRIGVIDSALQDVMPQALSQFVRAFPLVRIFIQTDQSMSLYESVQRGELDAAVCIHPTFALPKSMAWEQFSEQRLIVLAPSGDVDVDPNRLLRERPFVRYDRRLSGGLLADRYLREQGISPHERLELSSVLAISLMVGQGLGVSLVPDVASTLTRSMDLARLPVAGRGLARRFGMLWQRPSKRTRWIGALIEMAHRSAPP